MSHWETDHLCPESRSPKSKLSTPHQHTWGICADASNGNMRENSSKIRQKYRKDLRTNNSQMIWTYPENRLGCQMILLHWSGSGAFLWVTVCFYNISKIKVSFFFGPELHRFYYFCLLCQEAQSSVNETSDKKQEKQEKKNPLDLSSFIY